MGEETAIFQVPVVEDNSQELRTRVSAVELREGVEHLNGCSGPQIAGDDVGASRRDRE